MVPEEENYVVFKINDHNIMLSQKKNDLKLITSVFDNKKTILDYTITSNMNGIINNIMNFTDLPYYFNIEELEI